MKLSVHFEVKERSGLPKYGAECSLWSGRKVNLGDEVKCARFIVPTLFVLVEQVKMGVKQ